MKHFIRCIVTLFVAALALPTMAQATQPARPLIPRAVDAQPVDQFDVVVALGANTLHRYDNGPQKNVTLAVWTAKARAKGLYYILQGTAIEAQTEYNPVGDPYLLAITQDDEPDLNRYDSQKGKVPDEVLSKLIYYPQDTTVPGALPAPHKSMIGWTRVDVLADRYARWRAKWPGIPIRVNFSGMSITNGYYADGAQHVGYLKAADGYGWDWYAKTSNANQSINLNGFTARKLTTWGQQVGNAGATLDAYFECSEQKVFAAGRSPTPTEIHTTIWHLLANGVRGVSAFPQRIGAPFSYNAMTPEQGQAVREAYAAMAKYENLIANGTRTLTGTPAFAWNAPKGTYTLPTAEVVTWTLGDEKLAVAVDTTGATMPVLNYTGPAPKPPATQPTTQPSPTEVKLNELAEALKASTAKIDILTEANKALSAKVDELGGSVKAVDQKVTDTEGRLREEINKPRVIKPAE